MDYTEKESEEALTQGCVRHSDWLNWNTLSLTVIVLLYSYSKTWDQKLLFYTLGMISYSYLMKHFILFFFLLYPEIHVLLGCTC